VPSYEPEHIDAVDPVIQKLQKCTRTDKERSQFLTSPFLAIMSNSAWRMPPSLFHWLVLVMAVEQNTAVTTSIFSILQRALAQVGNLHCDQILSDSRSAILTDGVFFVT